MSLSEEDRTRLLALGQRIKSIRESKGMTLKELGHLIDKEPQSISRVEHGQINPTYIYLLKVCEGLGTNIEELISERN